MPISKQALKRSKENTVISGIIDATRRETKFLSKTWFL